MCRHHRTFTLIELLVVTVIILVIASLLLPALNEARGKAHQALCMSNCRQAVVTVIMWIDDEDEYYPSFRNRPDPIYSQNGAAGSGFEYYQRYMRDEYGLADDEAFRCPASDATLNLNTVWAYGYYSHMGFSAFIDYANHPSFMNESWGRGFWNVPADDRIRRTQVVSPEHKIVWLDSYDFYYAPWSQWSAAAYVGVYYDHEYDRHSFGVNTVMADGHGEWHRDPDLGVGDSEYQHAVKRYWFDFIHER